LIPRPQNEAAVGSIPLDTNVSEILAMQISENSSGTPSVPVVFAYMADEAARTALM